MALEKDQVLVQEWDLVWVQEWALVRDLVRDLDRERVENCSILLCLDMYSKYLHLF